MSIPGVFPRPGDVRLDATALAAMQSLIISRRMVAATPEATADLASSAYDIAEAMEKERSARLKGQKVSRG